MKPNRNYKKLESSYLFYDIEQRVKAYSAGHPDKKLLRLGVGDVTLPLCDAVIKAMYSAVDDQSKKETFHGYMPECGSEELKTAIAGYYARRGGGIFRRGAAAGKGKPCRIPRQRKNTYESV